MYCKNCGTDVPEGQLFCTNCGAAMKNQGKETLDREMKLKNETNQVGSTQKNKSYEFIKEHPEALRIVSILGSVLMFISIWLPLVTEKFPAVTLNSLSTGRADVQKITYSFWGLCEETEGLVVFAYFSLICIVFSIVFVLLKKHLPALIFGTLEMFPVYLNFFVALSVGDRISPSIAAFTTLIGWIMIVGSWRMNRKFKKMMNR